MCGMLGSDSAQSALVEAIAAVGPKATQEATLEAAVHWLMEHHTELPSPSSRKRQKRDPREFTDVTDVIHFDPEMDSGNVTPQHQVSATEWHCIGFAIRAA